MKNRETVSVEEISHAQPRPLPLLAGPDRPPGRLQVRGGGGSRGAWLRKRPSPGSPSERPAALSGRTQPVGPSCPRIVRFGAFEADLEERGLWKNGLLVPLQEKPFQILELLVTRRGETVTRSELCQRLWPDTHVVFDRSINTAVNKLRQALGDSRRSPRFIKTRFRLGYRFIAAVQPAGPAPAMPQAQDSIIAVAKAHDNLPIE